MPIPHHSERPDLYDYGDCRIGNSYPAKGSAELRAHLQEELKKLEARIEAKKETMDRSI